MTDWIIAPTSLCLCVFSPRMLFLCFLLCVTTSVAMGNILLLSEPPPPLLLVSFDGFRAEYLRRFPMPNLELLYSQGVLVEDLTNVFVTKTFPNHYTLVIAAMKRCCPDLIRFRLTNVK